jgi:cardiolipin synthase
MTLAGLSWEEIHYATEWAIRLAMLGILPFRRTPAAARSWLLLIFFLPIPGLLLFLAIGTPKFPAWRQKLFADMSPIFADLSARLKAEEFQSRPGEAKDLVERLVSLPAVGGNAVEILIDYEAVIARLIADIDGSRDHVRIISYIFADDKTGSRVIAALGRATERGVACHVLLDPFGSHRWGKRTVRRLRAIGVETRAALPMRLFRKWTRRDMRNHRKLFLIDGHIGYTGSQNIVDADFRKGITNREMVARVCGPVVAEMEAVFLTDWYLETQQQLQSQVPVAPAIGQVELQLLPSGADYGMESYLSFLVWLSQSAQDRITIVTPYFIPDEGLLGAIKTAVLRGVRVDIIVSSVIDQPLVHSAQCSYYDELLDSGASLYRFRDYLLHAKLVVVDEHIAIIGSSNADIRSFQLNEEISLLIHDRGVVQAIDQLVNGFRSNSTLLSEADWKRRPFVKRFAEYTMRLVSPLL